MASDRSALVSEVCHQSVLVRLGVRHAKYRPFFETAGRVWFLGRIRKIVATLSDEEGRPMESEKMMEIDFAGGTVIETGDQFGLGHVKP